MSTDRTSDRTASSNPLAGYRRPQYFIAGLLLAAPLAWWAWGEATGGDSAVAWGLGISALVILGLGDSLAGKRDRS